ncbi:hypothetical protein CSB37_03630 [bacterium DOLZORAL124_38_8]|nr:MAG: hypothetical protein CSB37_03630 [bacterium DOLZORAL124_38_8]
MIQYLLTLVASMTPLVEFRMAIPFGVSLGVPVWHSVLMSIIGGLIATKLLLFFLPKIIDFARNHWVWLDKKLAYLLKRTEKMHSKKMQNIGFFGMVFFVLLPIPGSGAYTSVLLAYIFRWPYNRSWLAISLGIILGSGLIGIITQSGLSIWHYIQSFL